MKMRLVFSTLAAFVLLAAFAMGQAAKPLTNDEIVQMVKAGFDEATILSVIESRPAAFDTSISTLLALKDTGVSQKVIAAMAERMKSKQAEPSPAPVPPAKANTNSPPTATRVAENGEQPLPAEVAALNQENGIYYKRENEFITVYGKPIVATNTGGFLKSYLTVGMSKIRMRAQLSGKNAQLQVPNRHPIFYFYMPEGQTPDSFSLIKIDIKGDRRQFEVGSAGGVTGSATSGLDIDKVCQIVIERVAPHIYRVLPSDELDDGEYGFIGTFTLTSAGVAGAGEKIYDFGIPKKK